MKGRGALARFVCFSLCLVFIFIFVFYFLMCSVRYKGLSDPTGIRG